MSRNFFRRIEVCVPVLDALAKRRVLREGLRPYLRDNTNAWVMDRDGNYRRRRPGRSAPFNAQAFLLDLLSEPEEAG